MGRHFQHRAPGFMITFANTAFIQTSPAIVAIPASNPEKPVGTIGVYEFLTKSFAYVGTDAFYWFEYFHDGKTWAQAVRDHNALEAQEIADEIGGLVDCGFLAVGETEAFERNAAFRANWKWDTTSALFHYTVTDNTFESQEESTRHQLEQLEKIPQPELTWKNSSAALDLPDPMTGTCGKLLSDLAKRRSVRSSAGHALTKEEIGACLYSGLGITGYVKTPTGELPLSLTPSGGARNPYEAYVILKRGADLSPGIYHYSASQHSLELVSKEVPACVSELLAGQAWTNEMAGLVILVAALERTMWKYPDPNAYRVVMIEAGHIGQNIMTAATSLGLSACPTAAIAHSKMKELLGLNELTHVPVYALTLDRPLSTADEIRPNKIAIRQDKSQLHYRLH